MIEEVKKIFDDIRDGIIEMGGDISVCTSPEEYAEAIKGLSGNNAVIFIPCFKVSETKPETPVKTMSPADPTDYPEGWGTPDGLTGKIWMTYTIVSVSTVYVPWTEPVLLGTAGESPTPPAYEPQVTRTFVICMELPEAEITPNIPTGGKWDIDENKLLGTIEYPSAQYTIESILSNGNTAGWSCNNTHVSGGFTWMSVGTFLAEDGSLIGRWSAPICINSARDGVDGHDGRNGVDGTDVEFIYKLFHNKEDALAEPQPESDPNNDDYIPGPNPGQKGYWTDQPLAIDPDDYPVEVMCQRKKNILDPNTGTKTWGPFAGPIIWSSWGEDGMDGDGVEYIFRIATNAEVTQDTNGAYHLISTAWPPTCGTGCGSAYYDVAEAAHAPYTHAELEEIYQEDEFVPGSDYPGHRPVIEVIGWDKNWTDDPRDVSVNEPFEFVSIRKQKEGVWQWFSEPKLWNKYYVAEAPVFTSFVYCRSTKNLRNMTLSGGTAANPYPTTQTVEGEEIRWYNTIPGATEYPNAPLRQTATVWMTSAIFGTTDPNSNPFTTPNWNSPQPMADTRFFNVEYSASATFTTPLPKFDAYLPGVVSGKDYPFIDNTAGEGVDEGTWRTYCTGHGYGTWGDETQITNPKWMATCSYNDGHWSDWTVTQIKGENGLNQATVTLYKSATSSPSVPSSAATYTFSSGVLSGILDGWSQTMPSVSGSNVCWVTQANAVSSSATVSIATGDWSTPRQITGTRGPIGPKMRMRNWSDSYTNPDSDGQSGWQCGDNPNDVYYDIAIWPNVQGGIDTNVADASDRLWRCTQNLDYTNVPAGSNPSTLSQYFTQAVGWDFVATNLLLANKISANQIDVKGISTDVLTTTPDEDGGYIDVRGNTMVLKNGAVDVCKVTGDELSLNADHGSQYAWGERLGQDFISAQPQSYMFNLHLERPLGRVIIPQTTGQQTDYFASDYPQYIGFRIEGTATSNGNFAPGENSCNATLFIKITNVDTGVVTDWHSGGYSDYGVLPYKNQIAVSFTENQTTVLGFDFKLDTTVHKVLSPGTYDISLVGDIYSSVLRDHTNQRIILSQSQSIKNGDPAPTSNYQSTAGFFSPIVWHHTSVTGAQTTEIAADGFGHILDSDNYFVVKHLKVNNTDTNTLILEFLANGTYGLQVSKDGIKYTTSGPSNWAVLNTP